MLTQSNAQIKEASDTIYHLTQEEKICLQCEAREADYNIQRTNQLILANTRNELSDAKSTINELK